jgi:NAD(P)-dependent dehydrogenase (short-subunit alcohol dehydrogenase family)
MNSETLIVFGSTSSIAKALLPDLNFEPNQIFSFDRVNPNQETNQYIPKVNQCDLDWGNLEEIEKSISVRLNSILSEPALIINFMGFYGGIQRIDELDIEDALLTNSKNLLPFFLIAKIAKTFPVGTRVISFSGAGVGGENLDDSSLGYLAAKASMAILTEAIDQQLARYGVRCGLISPGAFPSRMQEVVSQESSFKIPEARVVRAKEVMMSVPSTQRLAKLVIFLADNPQLLGGRTWSANFDDLADHGENFGKLRRIY